MQNSTFPIIDIEFEISGQKLDEFRWDSFPFLKGGELEIAQAIHKVILKNAWELMSLEELRCQIIKSLHFIDLIKIKMDFSEKTFLKQGLKIISAGTGDYTGGAINKTSAKKHKAVKLEAQPIAFGVGG